VFRNHGYRRKVAAVGLALAWAGCATSLPQRPVEDCASMTPTELRQPIEGRSLRIDDWDGNLPSFEMVVAAPLDEQGYVHDPHVVSSFPVGISNPQLLETISTWRFCPEVARALGGRPLRIPIRANRRAGMDTGEL